VEEKAGKKVWRAKASNQSFAEAILNVNKAQPT